MSSMRIWRCAAHNPTPAPLLRRHAASSARTFSGTFVLLSMAAEFAADGLAFQHGAGPASMNAMNWGAVSNSSSFSRNGWEICSLSASSHRASRCLHGQGCTPFSRLAARRILRGDCDVFRISHRSDRRSDPVLGGNHRGRETTSAREPYRG